MSTASDEVRSSFLPHLLSPFGFVPFVAAWSCPYTLLAHLRACLFSSPPFPPLFSLPSFSWPPFFGSSSPSCIADGFFHHTKGNCRSRGLNDGKALPTERYITDDAFFPFSSFLPPPFTTRFSSRNPPTKVQSRPSVPCTPLYFFFVVAFP